MIKQAVLNFSGGEVSRDLYGRPDSELYRNSLKRMQNYYARTQGPAEYRGGSYFVHPSKDILDCRIETFKFNDEQAYILAFTNLKVRIVQDASVVLETVDDVISGADQAVECTITATGHSHVDGDEVYIAGVVGMTELNGRFFIVSDKTANTFKIKDLFGNYVDSTGFTAYGSDGTATAVLTLTTPYPTADLFDFQFEQVGNDFYIDHRSYAPQKLIRVSATSWTFGTYVRTADPFTGAGKYPGCVTSYEGRVIHGSTTDNPDTFWMSRGPNVGASRYDDFTTGTDADHAIIFPVPSLFISWLAKGRDFIQVGTSSGVSGIDGGGDSAITPTNVRVRPLDPYGAQSIMPAQNGDVVFYMQKGSRVLRSLEYSLLSDAYKSFERSFVSSHMTVGGVRQLAFQRGKSDILWIVRNDGVLVGVTVKEREDVSGWHRHVLGGTGNTKVLSVAVEPQQQGYDRVYVVVERTINDTTVRYIEYFTDPFENVLIEDYYTEDGNESSDLSTYYNEVYEAQRGTRYLDSHLVFDGSDRGAITMTPGAVTGEDITFTASAGLFTASDVGKEIQKKYEEKVGGGRAIITSYTNTTVVKCEIISDFDSTDVIPAGSWYLTTDAVTGLYHLEGETVQVLADGRIDPEVTVTDGTVTITRQAAIIVIGYAYTGILITTPLALLAQMNNTLTDVKNVSGVGVLFSDSVGTKYGTSLYELQQIKSSRMGYSTDRPPRPTTGPVSNFYEDTWDEEKTLVILQDQPYPSFVNAINVTMEVGGK